jgi:hypothetical protein
MYSTMVTAATNGVVITPATTAEMKPATMSTTSLSVANVSAPSTPAIETSRIELRMEPRITIASVRHQKPFTRRKERPSARRPFTLSVRSTGIATVQEMKSQTPGAMHAMSARKPST